MFASVLSAVGLLLKRLLLIVVSLLGVLVLLGVGFAVLCGVLVWSLLRRRRPNLNIRAWQQARAFGAKGWSRPAPAADVQDADFREVGTQQPSPRHTPPPGGHRLEG
ncbi:hypothetical protein ACG0Z6_16180 [Roseateles sp. BYS180W]|uniref:Uncharacterized protein n=1 Tax=Roseateles rivi TaxID=3299028 RepID=A0ABW7FZK1_9BURK